MFMTVAKEVALQWLRDKETQLLNELGAHNRRFRTGISSSAQTCARHSSDPADMAGTANAILSPIHTQMGQQSRALDKVQRVIEGLENGSLDESYGFCEKCGEEIPEGRLRIQPETSLCVSCKRIEEQAQKRHCSHHVGRQAAIAF
jgi:DnaK suppressor protein